MIDEEDELLASRSMRLATTLSAYGQANTRQSGSASRQHSHYDIMAGNNAGDRHCLSDDIRDAIATLLQSHDVVARWSLFIVMAAVA